MNEQYQLILLALLIYVVTYFGHRIWHKKIRIPRRREFIKRYHFSASIHKKLAEDHPNLSSHDINMILDGLKQFFIIAHVAENRRIGMPSLIVDTAWHHFILHTVEYNHFCKQAFGQLFNHTPNSSIKRPEDVASELKLTWQIACNIENVNPKHPTRIPLLFSLDSKLDIPNGNYYELIEDELRFGHKNKDSHAQTTYPVTMCVSCAGGSSNNFGSGGGCSGGGGCAGGGSCAGG